MLPPSPAVVLPGLGRAGAEGKIEAATEIDHLEPGDEQKGGIEMASKRSVHIGGNAEQSVIVTGDHARIEYQATNLPAASEVDIGRELAAVRELLAALELSAKDRKKVQNALEEADDEAAEASPDRDAVGEALERALTVARKAEQLGEKAEKLAPHVSRAVGWLGENWHRLLGLIGAGL